MKFLIDAQLPPALARLLAKNGYDAIHTLSLPDKNLTPDKTIMKISLTESRVVVTKDTDFYHSVLLQNKPYKVLLVRVGNMKANTLVNLISENLKKIITSLRYSKMIELNKSGLEIIHK